MYRWHFAGLKVPMFVLNATEKIDSKYIPNAM
jgi:hypothetical protein